MKALLFSHFYRGDYDDLGYELYLIKDFADNVMYIGISRDFIWHRWFDGGTSHMDVDMKGRIYGKSYIGEVVERRFPISWNWIIELWTKEDCLKACVAILSNMNLGEIGIEVIEPYMINKYNPLYNVAHGDGRHEDRLTTKKLDALYKRLFG